MKCLKCGGNIEPYDVVCHSCGMRVSVMKQLCRISNKKYNKALCQAKTSDLSGALESLKLSVGFNSKNINALNLMGLVYLETGEAAKALECWVISSYHRKKNNRALRYIEYLDNNLSEIDKMDIGVKLYNGILHKLKSENYGAADPSRIHRIIENAAKELEGALKFNPKLLKAVNLLTLCYLMLGERSKALELTKSVLYADVTNREAALYFNILCPDRTRPPIKITGTAAEKKSKTELQTAPVESQGFFTSSMFMEAVSFLLGIIACTAVFIFLVIPGINENHSDRESANVPTAYEEDSMSAHDNEGTPETGISPEEIKAKEDSIKKAKELCDNFYYIDACGLIFNMDLSGISEDSRKTYNEIMPKAAAEASKALLELGQKSYNEGRKTDAKSFLDKALTYSENASEDDGELYETKYTVLFYLGRIALDNDEGGQAASLFSEVIRFHPDKKYVNYAEGYLNSLTED